MTIFNRDLQRRGTALFVLLTFIVILFIVGFSLIYVTTEEREKTQLSVESNEAFFLAESGIAAAEVKLRDLFSRPLIDASGEVDPQILAILDIDRAEHFSESFAVDQLPNHSQAKVTLSFQNIKKTPFVGFIDEYEKVPESLKSYKREGREQEAMRGLGGWQGEVLIESLGSYKKSIRKIAVTRFIKVTDLTPIAENYTLFIGSEKEEYLKEGEFRLSNFNITQQLEEMVTSMFDSVNDAVIKGMGKAAISLFWDPNTKTFVSFSGDFKIKALSIIRDLVMKSSDTNIKDYVDNFIAELNPYRWGRIRSNGKLHIYLPFFMADDIINYFDDNSIFSHQRPEIGYLYCYNLLHDPYLSRYTYYEGKIIKYFQKLKPYILGVTNNPYPAFEPYTITTRFDFTSRSPDKLAAPNYDRITREGRHYATEIHERDLVLQGTFKEPIQMNGIQYIKGDLTIGGFITGRAMFLVEGNIHITSDLKQVTKKDFIALASLKKKILLKRDTLKIEAALYAHESLSGGDLVGIFGNLAVHNLNRMSGPEGDLLMPKRVRVNYNPDMKSRIAGNISLSLSTLIDSYKDIRN